MSTSRPAPIGQLLGRALRLFRQDLVREARAAGYTDIRDVHMQVFGAIDWRGTRLTQLAARANMTAPAMLELVDELEASGYLERRADPTDRRAKLIRPTRTGRRALVDALRAVEAIEQRYAGIVGSERFEVLLATLEEIVTSQSPEPDADGSRPLATAIRLRSR